ncbi:hypothetical protein [Micromonospora coerulea]|uniref:hypothetical protein n=1 Tax=Micromonospora coerulea TaxID=47856 RepID=UPI001906CDDE|nr:hypothetical protein [Micromonospora veneta]
MNVGDRVIIRGRNTGGTHRTGDVGLITGYDPEEDAWPYDVSVRGFSHPYASDELALVPGYNLPPVVPEGMTPDALAEYVGAFVKLAQGRIKGTGADQYATPEGQRFERMTPGELVEWAREEAQDLAVYAAMLDIRLARVADALKRKGIADAA